MTVEETPGKAKLKEMFSSSSDTSVIFENDKSLLFGSFTGFEVTSLSSVPHDSSKRMNNKNKCWVDFMGKF